MKHTNLILAVVSLLVSQVVAYGAQQPGTQLPIQRSAPVKPVIIACQSPLVVENIAVQARSRSLPPGWSAEMPIHDRLTIKVVGHRASNQGTLICFYATNTDQDAFKFFRLTREVPAGKTCKSIPGFRFRCQ